MNDDLDLQENRIDSLERTFAEKHEQIKNQVEGFIELEYQNDKALKETKHKANLLKIENEKYAELNAVISTSTPTQKNWTRPLLIAQESLLRFEATVHR